MAKTHDKTAQKQVRSHSAKETHLQCEPRPFFAQTSPSRDLSSILPKPRWKMGQRIPLYNVGIAVKNARGWGEKRMFALSDLGLMMMMMVLFCLAPRKICEQTFSHPIVNETKMGFIHSFMRIHTCSHGRPFHRWSDIAIWVVSFCLVQWCKRYECNSRRELTSTQPKNWTSPNSASDLLSIC